MTVPSAQSGAVQPTHDHKNIYTKICSHGRKKGERYERFGQWEDDKGHRSKMFQIRDLTAGGQISGFRTKQHGGIKLKESNALKYDFGRVPTDRVPKRQRRKVRIYLRL